MTKFTSLAPPSRAAAGVEPAIGTTSGWAALRLPSPRGKPGNSVIGPGTKSGRPSIWSRRASNAAPFADRVPMNSAMRPGFPRILQCRSCVVDDCKWSIRGNRYNRGPDRARRISATAATAFSGDGHNSPEDARNRRRVKRSKSLRRRQAERKRIDQPRPMKKPEQR